MNARQGIDPAEQDLLDDIAGYHHDPLGFVRYAFPWGESELTSDSGPDEWQTDILSTLGERLRAGDITASEAIQIAVASGHGIGKSALVAWLILWALCTFEDTRGVVTANTENQLKTKTWAELAKWYRLMICKHWFALTATAIFSVDPEHQRTWRIDMVPWSEQNTEAFAGLHNKGKRILLVFDEASAIPATIWEVSEGALTDEGTEIIWAAFGNPTQTTGRFRECWTRFKHRWLTRQIDSRTVKRTNKAQIQKWLDDYGEDSDFFRVRVRGVFPRAGLNQLIGEDIVEACLRYKAEGYEAMPVIIGVDVARFGDDQSVIIRRQGRKVFPPAKFRGLDTVALAGKVIEAIREFDPDAVFIDGVGVGGGVVDQIRARNFDLSVFDVNAGARAGDEKTYARKDAEMWGGMKEFLKGGAELPDDAELREELTARQYGYTPLLAMQLEKKDDLKKPDRLGRSPDTADALAMTFAEMVAPRRRARSSGGNHGTGGWMAA